MKGHDSIGLKREFMVYFVREERIIEDGVELGDHKFISNEYYFD